ncbi:hypothetical protein Tco_1558627 [Tanacetum coccineum]
MSDSEDSTVTYTAVSSPFEDGSGIGSPGVDGPPIMPEDPYAYIMAAYQVPPSPDYISGPEVPLSPDYIPGPEVPPSPDYIPGPEVPSSLDYIPGSEEEPEEDDEHLKEDSADYPADKDDDDDDDDDKDEDEDGEEEEEHPASADSVPPVYRMTARISIQDEPSISLPPREEIPSPPLHIPAPLPNSPTHIEILESCLPLRKRVRFASPTPSHEVGESSVAGAARQDGPAIGREDPYSVARGDLYGFIDMVDVSPGHPMSKELDYGITDTWDDLETTIMYGIMEDAQDDRSQLRGRVNLLYSDRPVHRRLAVMIERERLKWLVRIRDYLWMLATMHIQMLCHYVLR